MAPQKGHHWMISRLMMNDMWISRVRRRFSRIWIVKSTWSRSVYNFLDEPCRHINFIVYVCFNRRSLRSLWSRLGHGSVSASLAAVGKRVARFETGVSVRLRWSNFISNLAGRQKLPDVHFVTQLLQCMEQTASWSPHYKHLLYFFNQPHELIIFDSLPTTPTIWLNLFTNSARI